MFRTRGTHDWPPKLELPAHWADPSRRLHVKLIFPPWKMGTKRWRASKRSSKESGWPDWSHCQASRVASVAHINARTTFRRTAVIYQS